MKKPAPQATILIVEDEDDLRENLGMILAPLADTILAAANGAEALVHLRHSEVHAVFSDINMPVLNGLELLREVRRFDFEVPFIFITAFGDKNNLLEALRLGALDFIEKPFSNAAVVTAGANAIELGLALRKMEREMNDLLLTSALPIEKVTRLKNMRKAVLHMKLECEIYSRTKEK